MPWVCQPCANGDHSSHDGTFHDGTRPEGDPEDHLDLYDCKVVRDDGQAQCLCRATWPRTTVDRRSS